MVVTTRLVYDHFRATVSTTFSPQSFSVTQPTSYVHLKPLDNALIINNLFLTLPTSPHCLDQKKRRLDFIYKSR